MGQLVVVVLVSVLVVKVLGGGGGQWAGWGRGRARLARLLEMEGAVLEVTGRRMEPAQRMRLVVVQRLAMDV